MVQTSAMVQELERVTALARSLAQVRLERHRVVRLSELLLLLWIRLRRRSLLQTSVTDARCRANFWHSSFGIPGAATGSHAPIASLACDATVRPPVTTTQAVTRD